MSTLACRSGNEPRYVQFCFIAAQFYKSHCLTIFFSLLTLITIPIKKTPRRLLLAVFGFACGFAIFRPFFTGFGVGEDSLRFLCRFRATGSSKPVSCSRAYTCFRCRRHACTRIWHTIRDTKKIIRNSF